MSLPEDRPLAAKTAVIASLGFAGLLGLIAVAATHKDVAPVKDPTISASAAKPALIAGSRRSSKHSRSDRWNADARTFVAVIRYLLEPEYQAQPGWSLPPLQATPPTNIVSTSAPMRSAT